MTRSQTKGSAPAAQPDTMACWIAFAKWVATVSEVRRTKRLPRADSRRQLHLVYLPSCSIVRRWGHWWPLFESSPAVESQGSHAYAPSVCRHPKPQCVNMVHLPGVVRLQNTMSEAAFAKTMPLLCSCISCSMLLSRPTSGQR